MDGGYRDDREGLRLQLSSLEIEVIELKRQLRIARDADVAAMRRELDRAEAQIARLESRNVIARYVFPSLAVGLFVGIGIGMLLSAG